MRGTIIIVNTLLQDFVNNSLIYCPIYVNGTGPHDISQVGSKVDVTTSLTPVLESSSYVLCEISQLVVRLPNREPFWLRNGQYRW